MKVYTKIMAATALALNVATVTSAASQNMVLEDTDNQFIAKVATIHAAGYYCPGWQARSDVEVLRMVVPLVAPSYQNFEYNSVVNVTISAWNGAVAAAAVAQPVSAPGHFCAMAAGLMIEQPELAVVPLRYDF